jgi:carboxymethylenebutenolidase
VRRAARRSLCALVALVGLAPACARRAVRWAPDPRVAHTDTAFVSGGARIVVERIAPPASDGRHPAILVLHPSDGVEGGGADYVRHYADEFALNGYVCFVVHYFDRTATVRSNDALEDEQFPLWTATLRDAVSFAERDPHVDPRRIGAFGFSLGGYMALALGAADRRIGSLVVLSGGFFDALAPTVRRLPPTLLLHGAADDVVPVAAAWRVDSTLAQLGVEHRLVIYPAQGHGLSPDVDPDAERRAVRFFDRHLR